MDTHEGITVKVLLDSGTTGILMNKKMVKKYSFKLQKLKRPLIVNGIGNSRGNISHTR